jgi:hypothetical protein
MGTTNYEHWLDDRTVIGAEFRRVDDVEEDDFGPRVFKTWEMVPDSFYAMIFVGKHNFEHSIKFVSKKEEDDFKEHLKKEFLRTVEAA